MAEPEYRAIGVGHPYLPALPGGWPVCPGGVAFVVWRRGMMDLVLAFADLTPEDVQAAMTGKVRVGLRQDATYDALLLLFDVEGITYGGAILPIAGVPEAERLDLSSPLATGARYLLTLVLVDAPGGTVRATRAVSLSPGVSRIVRRCVAREAFSLAELGRLFSGAYAFPQAARGVRFAVWPTPRSRRPPESRRDNKHR